MLLKNANKLVIYNVRWYVIKEFNNNPIYVMSFY